MPKTKTMAQLKAEASEQGLSDEYISTFGSRSCKATYIAALSTPQTKHKLRLDAAASAHSWERPASAAAATDDNVDAEVARSGKDMLAAALTGKKVVHKKDKVRAKKKSREELPVTLVAHDEHEEYCDEHGKNMKRKAFSGDLFHGGDDASVREAAHLLLASGSKSAPAKIKAVDAARATLLSAISADDVHQGYLGNCYFCAALAMLASTTAGQVAIANAITPLAGGKTFLVQFKTFLRGGTRQGENLCIVVNRDFWVCANEKHDAGHKGDLVYIKTASVSDKASPIWAMVLEKAWAARIALALSAGTPYAIPAKTMKKIADDLEPASYELLIAGHKGAGCDGVHNVVEGIAGWKYRQIGGQQTSTGLTEKTVEELWKAVSVEKNVAFLGTTDHNRAHEDLHLIGHHQYTAVATQSHNGEEMLALFNPHNRTGARVVRGTSKKKTTKKKGEASRKKGFVYDLEAAEKGVASPPRISIKDQKMKLHRFDSMPDAGKEDSPKKQKNAFSSWCLLRKEELIGDKVFGAAVVFEVPRY